MCGVGVVGVWGGIRCVIASATIYTATSVFAVATPTQTQKGLASIRVASYIMLS